jgi:hypothetical protein
MLRGCLFLILVYVVAFNLEYQPLKSLPFAGYAAAILALGVTLALGSLQGLAQAVRLRARHPTGDALRATISDYPALFCDYMGKAQHFEYTTRRKPVAYWHGLMVTHYVIYADNGQGYLSILRGLGLLGKR